ncbi:MAG: sulfatase [Verrucomicrobiota bacterium]
MIPSIARIVVLSLVCQVAFAETPPPNIIFLLADDQNFDSLGCYGNEDVLTPNIDALAARGVAFDNHYDTTAICMASRANILTGMYEYKTGCNFEHGDLPENLWRQSYPILLREAGYLTAFAGKIGVQVDGIGLPESDFDSWGAGPGQTNYATAKNKSMAKYAEEYPHSSRSYGAFGRDFIQRAVEEEKPFCLSISFKAPHMPKTPDPEFDHVYADKVFKKPENYGREFSEHFSEQSKQGRQYERFHSWGYSDKFDERMRLYHQQIYGIDVAVGMIAEALQAAEVADNTVVIYTSDNGFFCGAHGYGSKVLPYEEGSRVPLIIADPRQSTTHGKRSASLTGNIDFAPTLLELAGLKVPDNIDGVSLLPLLETPEAEVRANLQLMNFWGPEAAKSFGIVTRDWKYVHWSYEGNGMTATEELFDMRRDKLELANAALNPEKGPALEQMRALYDEAVSQIEANAVRPSHAKYGTIFDRHQSWDAKSPLIGKKKKR